MTKASTTRVRAMNRQTIVLAVGVVLIGVGVRTSDWPMVGAGVLAMIVFSGAFVIFTLKVRDPDVSSGDRAHALFARPVTPLTLTGIVLLAACLVEFALGMLEMRWVPCVVAAAAASQASLAYLMSAARGYDQSTPSRRVRVGRIKRYALSLYAMAVVLLAVNLGQF